MAITEIRTISFAGAGNVATHLAPALANAGYGIRHIVSRTAGRAEKLAQLTGGIPSADPSVIDDSADLLLLAISDHAIPGFVAGLKALGRFHGIVAHTSGSQPLSAISQHFGRAGIFYPLQTFSKISNPDIRRVPFCIEGDSDETTTLLSAVAARLSDDVRLISSEQRAILHLSAVFACNFTNHMYAIASRLIEKSGVAPDILLPLIDETAKRLQGQDPALLQTGPAVRGDISTIEKHLRMLEGEAELQHIYKMLSENIRRYNDELKR